MFEKPNILDMSWSYPPSPCLAPQPRAQASLLLKASFIDETYGLIEIVQRVTRLHFLRDGAVDPSCQYVATMNFSPGAARLRLLNPLISSPEVVIANVDLLFPESAATEC